MKNYKIEIWRDDSLMNPFEDWDCEPDIRVLYDRYYKDYAVEPLYDTIRHTLQNNPNIVIRNQREIADLVELTFDKSLSKDEKVDILCAEITNHLTNRTLYNLAQIAKIPCMLHESRGYSQGDYASVLILLTDKFFERTGCDRKNSQSIMEGTAKLFDDWAWGDVYGFTIYERQDYVKLTREDFDAGKFENVEDLVEWENIDSCGGFYGDDFTQMLDHIPDEYGLEEDVKNYSYENIK